MRKRSFVEGVNTGQSGNIFNGKRVRFCIKHDLRMKKEMRHWLGPANIEYLSCQRQFFFFKVISSVMAIIR